MNVPGRSRSWGVAAIIIAMCWIAAALGSGYLFDRGDKKDPPCPQSAPPGQAQDNGAFGASPVDLGTTEEKLEINFGVFRGAASDEVRLNAPSAPPIDIEVATSSVTGDSGTID